MHVKQHLYKLTLNINKRKCALNDDTSVSASCFHDGPSILATRLHGQEVSSANSRTYALALYAGQISAMFVKKTNSLSVATSCANTTHIYNGTPNHNFQDWLKVYLLYLGYV